MKILPWKLILAVSFALLLVLVIDIKEFDNILYHFFSIHPTLDYYDLRLWDFYQAVGAVGALLFGVIAAYQATRIWRLESTATVHATGAFLISTNTTANDSRNRLMEKFSTFQLLNVGRGPARNAQISVHVKEMGYVLEDFCADTFSIAGNSGTKEMNIIMQVHGQRFVKGDDHELEGDEQERFFYLHYQDHGKQPHVTKVCIKRVYGVEGELAKQMKKYPFLQLWKIVKNEDLIRTHWFRAKLFRLL